MKRHDGLSGKCRLSKHSCGWVAINFTRDFRAGVAGGVTSPSLHSFDPASGDPPEIGACPLAPSYRRPIIWYGCSVYYTADMVRALPDDGNRYETVHGSCW